MKNSFHTLLTILFLSIGLCFISFADDPIDPIDPPCDNVDPSYCPDAPFDGGASSMIAGGAGLLGWTAFKKKKND